ncbi:MAG: DMT family transporter, partial [Pseudomonadota bacterium]
EPVGPRRWSATFVGFVGTLIILRPGSELLSAPALVALAAAGAMACSVLIIKVLSRTEPANAIVAYMVLMMTPLSLVPALLVWEWPSLYTWAIAVAIGVFGTTAHMLFTRGIQLADASLVMPFDFVRLPMVAALGYLLFDQTVDRWTWLGAVVIFGAGVYIAHREGRRKPRTPAAPKSLSEGGGPG